MTETSSTVAASSPTPYAPILASEEERERARKQLQCHFADDHLSIDALEERLEAVENSETRADLQHTLQDLPGLEGHSPLFSSDPASEGVDGASEGVTGLQIQEIRALHPSNGRPARLLALMGGFRRAGRWAVPEKLHVAAFWGGARLDFRQADFTSSEVLIDARASMGSIVLWVPDDVAVESTGRGLMGRFSQIHHRPAHPRATLLVQGFAFWAGVSIRIVPTPIPTHSAKSPPLE